mgnify:FL=1
MKVLIVDDNSFKIASIVKTIKENTSENLEVNTVLDYVNAVDKLVDTIYDLFIVDVYLPIRYGETPIQDGGVKLVKEVERNTRLNKPGYIIGITQYEEYLDKYLNDIWPIYHYSKTFEWKKRLQKVITHIKQTYSGDNEDYKPTVFVEGLSDKKVIDEAFSLFYPHIANNILIKSDNNAGATWVSNQIIAWAFSLKKYKNNKFVKAIGLLDGDEAGKEARRNGIAGY